MNRAKFLKNQDMIVGLKFCAKCGEVIENINCGPCEAEALRKIAESNIRPYTTRVSDPRQGFAASASSMIFGWENTADPSTMFATVSGTASTIGTWTPGASITVSGTSITTGVITDVNTTYTIGEPGITRVIISG